MNLWAACSSVFSPAVDRVTCAGMVAEDKLPGGRVCDSISRVVEEGGGPGGTVDAFRDRVEEDL